MLCASGAGWAAGTLDTLKFSHKTHIQDIGASCTDCHDVSAVSKKKPDAIRATEQLCKKCHDGATADSSCAKCHTNPAAAKKAASRTLNATFKHAPHVKQRDKCATCHAGVENVDAARSLPLPGMNACMTCHNNRTAPKTCAVCHPDLSLVRPASHTPQWLTRYGHGAEARSPQADCESCHATSECTACHRGNSLVAIHSPGYEFEHGADVKRNDLDCTVCHETRNFCSRCHEGKR
jgi:hypothetical protein